MIVTKTALQLLKHRGEACLPGFGRFYLKQSAAHYDAASGRFLPPGMEVFYDSQMPESTDSLPLFATAAGITQSQAEREIQEFVDLKNRQLAENQYFKIENIGVFTETRGVLNFKGDIIGETGADFYGLQEVSLDNLKKSHGPPAMVEDYKFSNAVLRWFLLIIPIAGLCLAVFARRDLLFGKKSFPDISVKNSTHRLAPAKSQEIPNQKPVPPAPQNTNGK